MIEKALEMLQSLLDQELPEASDRFYTLHVGFRDPFGVVRRLINEQGWVAKSVDRLKTTYPDLDVHELVAYLLNKVPNLPPPVQVDYRPFRTATPFPPHLVCFALAYIKEWPGARFIEPFTILVIRTGWWAGDENCIDDVLDALGDKAAVCKIAAASLLNRLSPFSVFAAGQLLYHLQYGENWGLRDYVRSQYEEAARMLKDPEDLREVRARLKSGLKPWSTMHQ